MDRAREFHFAVCCLVRSIYAWRFLLELVMEIIYTSKLNGKDLLYVKYSRLDPSLYASLENHK